jgi:hypothetical protein
MMCAQVHQPKLETQKIFDPYSYVTVKRLTMVSGKVENRLKSESQPRVLRAGLVAVILVICDFRVKVTVELQASSCKFETSPGPSPGHHSNIPVSLL